jgi:VanZ family protein
MGDLPRIRSQPPVTELPIIQPIGATLTGIYREFSSAEHYLTDSKVIQNSCGLVLIVFERISIARELMVPYLMLCMHNEGRVNVPTRPNPKRFVIDWGPAIVWAGIIFFLSNDQFSSSNTSTFLEPLLSAMFSGITPERFDTIHFVIRKLGHCTEYFIFSLLLIRALSGRFTRRLDFGRAVSIVAAVLLYALSDEFHQVFVPSRTASLADVGIDSFAGICGILWTYLGPKGKPCATDANLDGSNQPEFCKKT